MAGCSSCHHNRAVATTRATTRATTPTRPSIKPQARKLIVGASTSKNLVKLRYYGGGMGHTTSGCHACGSAGRYALKTSETIQFASDDSSGGWFSKRFDSGHDYYVTEKQAEYLLTLTYSNPAGQVIHKFKKVE